MRLDVSEDLMAHILELPYQGDDISMFILLPPFTKEDGIETILKKLTLEKFKAITQSSNLNTRTVQVALPKFSLEHTLELVPVSVERFVSFSGGGNSSFVRY